MSDMILKNCLVYDPKNKIDGEKMDICMSDGKIVEKASQVWDFMDFFKQLGVIEYTEKGKKLFPEK